MRVQHRQNGVIVKILSRIVWHPAWHARYPVRFRVRSDIRTPTIRFNGHWLDVRLPPEFGRLIKILAKLVRQLRLAYPENGKPKTKRKPKQITFHEVVEVMDEPKPQYENDSANSNGKTSSLLSLTCRCGRTIEIPPEWIFVARCCNCGLYLSERGGGQSWQ